MFFTNSPKCVKRRRLTPFGAMRAPFSAMKSPFDAFLRLLTPFCAFMRTFAVLGQAEIFRCKYSKKSKYFEIFFKYKLSISNSQVIVLNIQVIISQ